MKRILKKITKDLSEIPDLKLVILYGSYARGENIVHTHDKN
jgi:predicted nucleotidyltransferase